MHFLLAVLLTLMPSLGSMQIVTATRTTGGGGATLTFGALAVGLNTGSATTSIATNISGSTLPTVSIPSGALAIGVCSAGGTGSGTTFSFADNGGNSWTPLTLQYHATSGSIQVFYTLSATAAASDFGTCTISPSLGGNIATAYLLYVTRSSGSWNIDVTTAGNNTDGGSGTTSLASAAYSTAHAVEFTIMASEMGTGAGQSLTSPQIGGLTATLYGNQAGTSGGSTSMGQTGVQYLITSTAISSTAAALTQGSSVPWVVTTPSWY